MGSVLALALQQKCTFHHARSARKRCFTSRLTRISAILRQPINSRKTQRLGRCRSKSDADSTIHISQRGGLGRTKLTAVEHGLEAIGYVLSYGALTHALDAQLDLTNVLYEAEAKNIQAKRAICASDF